MSDRDASTRLLCAGLSASLADVATFPLDTLKVRLQVGTQSGLISCATRLIAQEGAPALYNGLAAGLQRQFAFASIRIGFYEPVKQLYARTFHLDTESHQAAVMGVRLLAGCSTGALAVLCAQPTDVVKVRMQGGVIKYKGTLSAYSTIFKTEGVRGLWKGFGPNVARNAIVNCSEVVTYDTLKTYLIRRFALSDTVSTHFLAGLGSGFVTTLIASPVDVVKTRYMNSKVGTYNGVANCALQLARESGLRGFYRGFLPSFLRIAGWNVLMFVLYEKTLRASDSAKEVLKSRVAFAKEKPLVRCPDEVCCDAEAQRDGLCSSEHSNLCEGFYMYNLLMTVENLR